MDWSGDAIATVAVGVAILAFLWNLHRDVGDLRERMTRLEGLVEGFTGRGLQGVGSGPGSSGED